MAEITIYSGAEDGCVGWDEWETSWATVHGKATGNVCWKTGSSNTYGAMVVEDSGYSKIYRSFFPFDLSSLPAGSVITAVSLLIHPPSSSDWYEWICAQEGTQGTVLSTADFDAFTGTKFGEVDPSTSFEYQEIIFNAAGIAYIQGKLAAGAAYICARDRDYDYDNSEPGSNGSYGMGLYYSEASEASLRPKLVVTYTPPSVKLADFSTDARAIAVTFQDCNLEVAVDYSIDFIDFNTDINSWASKLINFTVDIQTDFPPAFFDLYTEIFAGKIIVKNLNVDIATKYGLGFCNFNTIVGAGRINCPFLKTEIIITKYASWVYRTEWNPQRFLNTEITAKQYYDFSFRVMTGEEYALSLPVTEFMVAGGKYPFRTLFLDYIKLDSINEYAFQLWWARGLQGKTTLKNAKISAHYINTEYSGGYEVVTLKWLSCKVGSMGYKDLGENSVELGNIPCDSYLDFTLRVECPDCALTRGVVYFNLNITGDYHEPAYGGTIVYGDGSQYHAGSTVDDYKSDPIVCRLYVNE